MGGFFTNEPPGKPNLVGRNPKESTKKVLELIKESSKASGYKIKIKKKTIIFLYICNEQYKNAIKKIIPFIITSKRRINLTKVQNVYSEKKKKNVERN